MSNWWSPSKGKVIKPFPSVYPMLEGLETRVAPAAHALLPALGPPPPGAVDQLPVAGALHQSGAIAGVQVEAAVALAAAPFIAFPEPQRDAYWGTESTPETLFNQASADSLCVFDFSANTNVQLPALSQSTVTEPDASPLPTAPLAIVPNHLSSGLPEEGAASSAPDASSAATGSRPAPATFPPAGGESQAETEREEYGWPAFGGPNPLDALRDLRLFRPSEEDEIAPPAQTPDGKTSLSDNASTAADSEPVWADLSWLERPVGAGQVASSSGEQDGGLVERFVLQTHTARENGLSMILGSWKSNNDLAFSAEQVAVAAKAKLPAVSALLEQQPVESAETVRASELPADSAAGVLGVLVLPWWSASLPGRRLPTDSWDGKEKK